jgi:hypothetical protein
MGKRVSRLKRDYKFTEKNKIQITNNKWFDRLTTLSQVEGQYPMTKITNSKHSHTAVNTIYLVSDIGILNLLFIWNLVLVYRCLIIKEANNSLNR